MARLIAFYLPQYHPIPENDEWWGKGFTEWTNVGKAKPLFRGHYQPHVPADLGYYDLRVPETRAAQAAMAKEHGIEAFCYYHYWFAGRRILERPFNEVLGSGEPDFPFCLCWANQTWTGIWHGCPNKVLIEQTYPGFEDHQAHFNMLLPAFMDSRYLTVDRRPLFLVYDPDKIPDVGRVLDFWRGLAVKSGLPGLYMVAVQHGEQSWNPQQFGFDGTVRQYLPALRRKASPPWGQPVNKMLHLFQEKTGKPTIYPYEKALLNVFWKKMENIDNYPCLLPNWDNTPRSGANGLVLHGSSPEIFRRQVKMTFEEMKESPQEHSLIFIKAWNEWAEGNHLEPDIRFGKAYLEILRDEVFNSQ